MRNLWPRWVIGLVTTVSLTTLSVQARSEEPRSEILERLGPVTVGKACPGLAGWAPDGATLVKLDQFFAGDVTPPSRTVIVTFFATWCKPCKAGLVRLDRFVSDHHDRVRGVAVALGEEGAPVAEHLARLGVSLPAVADRFGALAERWGVYDPKAAKDAAGGLPRTFVIGPDRVVRRILGIEGPDFEAILAAAAGLDTGTLPPAAR